MLFWNHWISQRATVPGQYFLVFFTFPAWRNSFWGALPPTVSWSFLLAGSSLPDVDGPATATVWANCQVRDNEGNLPTPSSCSASAILLIISSTCRGASLAGVGGAPVMRASSPSFHPSHCPCLLYPCFCTPLPLSWGHHSSCHAGRQFGSISQ